MQVFAESMFNGYIEQSTDYVARNWPIRAAEYPDRAALHDFVSRSIRHMRALTFRRRDHLRKLLDWECEFGPGYVDKPEWQWLKKILTSDLDHSTRIFRIGNRIRKLREKASI
jgi:hypothetical protein